MSKIVDLQGNIIENNLTQSVEDNTVEPVYEIDPDQIEAHMDLLPIDEKEDQFISSVFNGVPNMDQVKFDQKIVVYKVLEGHASSFNYDSVESMICDLLNSGILQLEYQEEQPINFSNYTL